MLTPEQIAEAFGDDRAEVLDAAGRLAEAIVDLIPLMAGQDDGGAVRVGFVLVGLGRKLAGVEIA